MCALYSIPKPVFTLRDIEKPPLRQASGGPPLEARRAATATTARSLDNQDCMRKSQVAT